MAEKTDSAKLTENLKKMCVSDLEDMFRANTSSPEITMLVMEELKNRTLSLMTSEAKLKKSAKKADEKKKSSLLDASKKYPALSLQEVIDGVNDGQSVKCYLKFATAFKSDGTPKSTNEAIYPVQGICAHCERVNAIVVGLSLSNCYVLSAAGLVNHGGKIVGIKDNVRQTWTHGLRFFSPTTSSSEPKPIAKKPKAQPKAQATSSSEPKPIAKKPKAQPKAQATSSSEPKPIAKKPKAQPKAQA